MKVRNAAITVTDRKPSALRLGPLLVRFRSPLDPSFLRFTANTGERAQAGVLGLEIIDTTDSP